MALEQKDLAKLNYKLLLHTLLNNRYFKQNVMRHVQCMYIIKL